MGSLTDRLVSQVQGGHVSLPASLSTNQTLSSPVSLQSIMNRLAVADRSATAPNTNVSRSVSFSILDRDGNEVAVRTDPSHPIEIIIPRDENLLVPPMILQNVTSLSLIPHAQTLNLHFVNLSTQAASFSIHLQLRPQTSNISFLLIYKFDQSPRLNSSMSDIDGWSLFCSSSLYTHFLDNAEDHWSSIDHLRYSATERHRSGSLVQQSIHAHRSTSIGSTVPIH